MNLSVIIVTTENRRALLEDCLKSISLAISNITTSSNIEIIIGQNSDDHYGIEVPSEIRDIVKIEHLGIFTPAKARNILSQKSRADFLLFLDDDILVPSTYIETGIRILKDCDYSILGGPDSKYPNSNTLETSLNLALMSFMTTFNTRSRHSNDGKDKLGHESNLTLANLWIKNDVFNAVKFDESFARNEENILLNKLKDERALYSNQLFIYHKRRNSITDFLRPSFLSGFNRIKMYFHYPQFFDIKYTIPLLTFFIHLILLFTNISIFLTSIFMYLFLVLLTSTSICIKHGSYTLIPLVFIIQPLIVLSYCFGQIAYIMMRFKGIFNA